MNSDVGCMAVAILILALFLGAIFGFTNGRNAAMTEVHARLSLRCVEGEQYSSDLLACVVTRQGR